MANYVHDVYRQIIYGNLTVASAQGSAASTASFSAQTYFVRLCAPGTVTSTSGVRYKIGDEPVVTSTDGAFLPCNWVEVVKCTPGQKISALGNDSVAPTGGLNIVQLSD